MIVTFGKTEAADQLRDCASDMNTAEFRTVRTAKRRQAAQAGPLAIRVSICKEVPDE